jgi:hypothetical protein
MAKDTTVSLRHIKCLSAMARAHFNGAPQLLLVTAMMALVEPFYSASRVSLEDAAQAPMLRTFRFDIFWFLSCALSTLFAKLDAPLACLAMAKKCWDQQLMSLGNQMRYVIMYQNILVMYGHWRAAKQLFYQWFFRIPISSWMFEELVLVHVKGVFCQIEDLLMELALTQIMHRECGLLCYDRFLENAIKTMERRVKEIQSIVHQCLAKEHIHFQFQTELKLIQQVCKLYNITLKKSKYFHSGDSYSEQLTHVWRTMQWDRLNHTSHHIEPFLKQLPYSIAKESDWRALMNEAMDKDRHKFQNSSFVSSSRRSADVLFSLITCMLHHIDFSTDYTCVIERAIEEYGQCTDQRHYRIPLLKRLLDAYNHVYSVVLDRGSILAILGEHAKDMLSCEHPGVPQEKVTAIGMTLESIRLFSAKTLQDGLVDFAHVDWSDDDKFCAYLRQQDEMMPVWIDVGLQMFRFAFFM